MRRLFYILFFVSVFLFTECTDKVGTRDTLLDAGLHPIEVGGYGWFKKGEDDVYCTKFKAYSPDSTRIVHGVVTRGWFKGGTIRYD